VSHIIIDHLDMTYTVKGGDRSNEVFFLVNLSKISNELHFNWILTRQKKSTDSFKMTNSTRNGVAKSLILLKDYKCKTIIHFSLQYLTYITNTNLYKSGNGISCKPHNVIVFLRWFYRFFFQTIQHQL
jgi:hypothetical protein